MDSKKIYIGLYKEDNHESLFYQKDINIYYDLKEKKDVNAELLDLNSLILYNHIVGNRSDSETKMVELYDSDRMQQISLSKLFIGSVYEICNVSLMINYSQENNILELKKEAICDVKKVESNVLFLAKKNQDIWYSSLLDIEKGTLYLSDINLVIGSSYVPRNDDYLRPIDQVIDFTCDKMENGKILKVYRDYKKRIVD